MVIYTLSSTDPKHYNRIQVKLPVEFASKFVNVCVTSLTSNCNIEVMNEDDYITFLIEDETFRVVMTPYSKLTTASLPYILQDIFNNNNINNSISRQYLWEYIQHFLSQNRYSRLIKLFTMCSHCENCLTITELTDALTLFLWMESVAYNLGDFCSPQSYHSLAAQCANAIFSDHLVVQQISYSQCISWLYYFGHRYLVTPQTILPFDAVIELPILDVLSCIFASIDHNALSFQEVLFQMHTMLTGKTTSEDLLLLLMAVYRPLIGSNEYKYFRSFANWMVNSVRFAFKSLIVR